MDGSLAVYVQYTELGYVICDVRDESLAIK